MKKKCTNCKWSLTASTCEPVIDDTTGDTKLMFKRESNSDGNCQYHKRKWFSFFIRKNKQKKSWFLRNKFK